MSDPTPLKVLCVDDCPDVTESLALLLGAYGFDARACYDGTSALAEATVFLPGVCLIDLNMPGMAGDVLAGRLRELPQPPTVLVAVTAMNNAASSRRVRDTGFDLHLVKPVDPDQLIAVLDQAWRALR